MSDNLMLVDTSVHDGKVYHVFRNNDTKQVTKIDANYEVFSGVSSKHVESKDNLKSTTISYWKRKEFIDRNPITYQVDMSLPVYKNIQWRKNNTEAFYPLKTCHIDIEVFAGDQDINFSDLKVAAAKFPISLVTLYDNYSDKYYTIVNQDIYTGSESVSLDIIMKHIEEEKQQTINSVSDEKTKKKIAAMYDKISSDKIVLTTAKNLIDLISQFQTIFDTIDPDIVTGWNTEGFDIPYIYYTFENNGMTWSNRYGPVSIDTFSLEQEDGPKFIIPFVINLDYLKLYKERSFGESESYRLGFIAAKELHITKVEMDDSLDYTFLNHINKYIAYNIMDVHLVRMLDETLTFIDLTYAIVKETNISWSESFSTLRMVDGLLFTFLDNKSKTMKTRPRTTAEMDKLPGAFVRHPIKGVFSWLADLDLKSLYPYIMARYNMSPDTLVGMIDEEEAYRYIYYKDDFMKDQSPIRIKQANRSKEITREHFHNIVTQHNLIITVYGTLFKNHKDELSALYEVVEMLINQRTVYKNKMFQAIEDKDETLANRYKNIQNTYKVLTNSLYGAIGNKYFRLFNYDVARSITTTGKELIKLAAYHVNEYINNMSKTNDVDTTEFPTFNPNFLQDAETILTNVIYGDSVSGDSMIRFNDTIVSFDQLFNFYKDRIIKENDKEYLKLFGNISTISETMQQVMKPVDFFVRHKTNKKRYKITSNNKSIIVTEDHSLMVLRDNNLIMIKPTELETNDLLVIDR